MSSVANRHLGEAELVDLIEHGEGRLRPERAAHLTSCEACRRQAAELRDVMLSAADVTLPEPSPLFWEHQSRRVTEAIEREIRATPRQTGPGWRFGHLTTAVTTATVVLAVVLGVPYLGSWSRGRPADIEVSAGIPDRPTEYSPVPVDADEPADWALLLSMAGSVEWSASEPEILTVGWDAVDEAVSSLTDEERRRLVQLLQAELQGGGW